MIAVLAVVAAAAGGTSYVASNLKQEAEDDLVERTVSNVFSNMAVTAKLDEVYQDADGDLVADAPEKAALLAKPTELVFSFIASEDPANVPEVWEVATNAIGEKTSLPVTYLRLEDSKTQLAALRGGQIHVTAFSSGAVPTAVNQAGFVPLCTIGKAAAGDQPSEFGYTMQFIVKADSPIKDLKGLREKKIAFVRPRSNSGCKAAMILLWETHGLQPERDYSWYYSYSHNNSIDAVVSGKADAAPVASDILTRTTAKEEVPADALRVIYESERFPPVAFGCAYNLSAQLRDSIQAALLDLDWTGTKLAEEMSPGETKKFLPIVYKDDWANIRRVDQAASNANNTLR
ncbi:MAG: phosphate/phosphite/phosphonate ABC transporter substrate-binding protein [Bythopirellula sp.]